MSDYWGDEGQPVCMILERSMVKLKFILLYTGVWKIASLSIWSPVTSEKIDSSRSVLTVTSDVIAVETPDNDVIAVETPDSDAADVDAKCDEWRHRLWLCILKRFWKHFNIMCSKHLLCFYWKEKITWVTGIIMLIGSNHV